MTQNVQGRLEPNWDSYWKGFITIPMVSGIRNSLIRNCCRKLLKEFSLEGKGKFCEIGAGTGIVSRYLGDTYNADIATVDNNEQAITICQKTFENFPHGFEQIKRDAFDLEDYKGEFDLVHSGGLIEHFVDDARDKIIQVHADLVRDNGYIMILVPTINMWYRILNYGVFKVFGLLDEIPEVPWDYEELKESLEKYGFKILSRASVLSEFGVLAKKVNHV